MNRKFAMALLALALVASAKSSLASGIYQPDELSAAHKRGGYTAKALTVMVDHAAYVSRYAVDTCTVQFNPGASGGFGYAKASSAINGLNPGSSFTCGSNSGMILSGGNIEVHMANAVPTLVVARQGAMGNNLEYRVSLGDGNVRVSDPSGNYISFNSDREEIYDVKLPISASSNISVLREKGVSFGDNELISLLNTAYHTNVTNPEDNMLTFSSSMLTSSEYRGDVFAFITKALAVKSPKKAQARPMAGSNADAIAELRAELDALKAERTKKSK